MRAVPTFRARSVDLVAGASRGFVGTPGLPPPIRARLEAAFAAALAESVFLRDAERAGMPLRRLVGGPYAAMIAETEAGLRRL
jgi:tripartite-type tricarboxylate transporter receptor subunit TctC